MQPNPERFTGSDEGKLWAALDVNPTTEPPLVAYEIWQAGGGLLERRELSYDEVNSRAKINPSPPLLPARMDPKQSR